MDNDKPKFAARGLLMLLLLLATLVVRAQREQPDTGFINANRELAMDTSIDYDDFLDEFETFLDSILTPRSYFMPTISFSRGYYNFSARGGDTAEAMARLTITPSLSYYHHSGWGLSGTASIVDDGNRLNLYQYSVSPSFDYLRDRRFATGVVYTRYFTRDSLPFYTSPLQNEVYVYFSYRKPWLRSSVAVNYGWGSRSDYQERKRLIRSLRLRKLSWWLLNREQTESISDFSVTVTLRHDFYWLHVFSPRDHIRFTPQVAMAAGTQQFGFNQTSTLYGVTSRNNIPFLFNARNSYLDDKLKFQPLSATLYLRGEYVWKKFFVQPQVLFDYYFPGSTRNLTTSFSLNAGFVL